MQTTFETLKPLARAAVPDHSTAFDPALVLWTETLPGGTAWSGVLRRGNTLRFTDAHGTANVAALLYNAAEKTERYNMPDTLKAQHTAYLTAGHVCYTDMGRVLCSIPTDTCGWHDTVCGTTNAAGVLAKHGEARYQAHRNAMFRNGNDSFLVELEKWGLDKRDVVANLNLFSKVLADAAGKLQFATTHRAPSQTVDLRFEMDTLVVLSATPHPLDPNPNYAPADVEMTVWRSGTAGADDICRLHCPENGRGLINTERYYL
jgi:urea carboxylase-associated protein 2